MGHSAASPYAEPETGHRVIGRVGGIMATVRVRPALLAAAVLLFGMGVSPAGAVIRRIYPLADIIADADLIATMRVSARDKKTHRITLAAGSVQKGPAAPARLVIRSAGGDDVKQGSALEARLSPGRSVLLFAKTKRFAIGYVEGTWFRLAEPKDGDLWQFVHLEPFLTRTFQGSSAKLQQVVTDAISGKTPAPAPNPEVKPGIGAP